MWPVSSLQSFVARLPRLRNRGYGPVIVITPLFCAGEIEFRSVSINSKAVYHAARRRPDSAVHPVTDLAGFTPRPRPA